MNSPEIYAVVFALAPGKTNVDVIWAGSDDGLIHLTRDGGKTWTNVTPGEMPDLGRVSQIDASSFDAGTAYAAVKRPLLADFAPYIFRTHDFGRTWTKIVSGIAANDYAHVVREDPARKGLLYAGTEHGFYLSFDDGGHWQNFSLNLPDTQVSDIWVEANDIAIATHGRGFYILDAVGPLRQYGPEATSATAAYLFKPGDAIRSAGNAPVTYWLKKPAESLTLEILDSKGQVIRSFNGAMPKASNEGRGGDAAATETGVEPEEEGAGGGRGGPPTASMAAGVNRVTWDLRTQGVIRFPGMVLWGATTNGPTVLPGAYQARLTVDGRALSESFTVRKHPWHVVSDGELQEQFDLASRIRDKVNEANAAIVRIRRIKEALADREKKSQNADIKAIAEQFAKEYCRQNASLFVLVRYAMRAVSRCHPNGCNRKCGK